MILIEMQLSDFLKIEIQNFSIIPIYKVRIIIIVESFFQLLTPS
jgi:hypothetical protein